MGTADEKATTRSTKEEFESELIPGGTRIVGSESKGIRNQQERDNRTGSSQSSFFSAGTAITGGMLDHLIDECCDQVSTKQQDIQRLESELKRLESKIDELKTLKEELNKQAEENI